jgi:hypothetical protein
LKNRSGTSYTTYKPSSLTPDLNSPDIIESQNKIYLDNLADIKDLYGNGYNNWTAVDQDNSKWMTASLVDTVVKKAIRNRQVYLNLKQDGKAAPIHGVGLFVADIANNLSAFQNYCPVALLDHENLVPGVGGTKLTVEYKNLFYNLCDEVSMRSFLAYPDKYITMRKLPLLPRLLEADEVPVSIEKLELKGYCPVTLFDGPEG